jgi:hypothetical protein
MVFSPALHNKRIPVFNRPSGIQMHPCRLNETIPAESLLLPYFTIREIRGHRECRMYASLFKKK